MTQKSRTDIKDEANANIEDNSNGNVTPADVRSRIIDLADSCLNKVDDPDVPAMIVHDTTASPITVTHSPDKSSVVYFKNNGTGSLTVNAGAGLTFEGGGTSIVSNEKGDVIGLQKVGSVLYFL